MPATLIGDGPGCPEAEGAGNRMEFGPSGHRIRFREPVVQEVLRADPVLRIGNRAGFPGAAVRRIKPV